MTGHSYQEMETSELRVPADPNYVIVAKRATMAFGAVYGFGVDQLDELMIAVAQACENAIATTEQFSHAGCGCGQLRLTFTHEEDRLEVRVRSVCSREALEAIAAQRAVAVAKARARIADQQAQELLAATDLALKLTGLFVDQCAWRVDERAGGLSVRLTKYRIS